MKKSRFLPVVLALLLFCLLSVPASSEEVVSEEVVSEAVLEEAVSEASGEMSVDSSALGGEADLASAYIANAMPHRRILRISLPSGLRLPEPDRSLYIALRNLVSAVAAGEESSTAFAIPYEDVFQNTFTAEELGVSVIVEYDENGNKFITPEAKSAALAAMVQNRSRLCPADAVLCLIADTPYELYWYDKSEGHGARVSYETKTYSATATQITVRGNILVRMSVSRDYALQAEESEGSIVYSEYAVDPAYGDGVRLAAENAAQILNENKNKTDEEKLAAYRDAICALTDYNGDASDTDPYGDPWQLVWVFDGKPNTKVVCEGYAKAFQYLCDQGTASATAISVQGRTNGPHMWNIVTVSGHRYLVDLTNVDLGYDLFMKGFSDGSVASGYTVRHNRGTMKYVYNEGQTWTEEDLTLYPMDYSSWKAAVEKAPEVRLSSDVLFPGYAAALRLVNEDPAFPATLLVHRVSVDPEADPADPVTEEFPLEDGLGYLSEPGEYTFTAIRDGVESLPTETFTLSAADLPEGPTLRLPPGADIQPEAFAGNESLVRVEAEDAVFRTGAFAGSPVLLARLAGTCLVEPAAFEETTVLVLDRGTPWPEDARSLFE